MTDITSLGQGAGSRTQQGARETSTLDTLIAPALRSGTTSLFEQLLRQPPPQAAHSKVLDLAQSAQRLPGSLPPAQDQPGRRDVPARVAAADQSRPVRESNQEPKRPIERTGGERPADRRAAERRDEDAVRTDPVRAAQDDREQSPSVSSSSTAGEGDQSQESRGRITNGEGASEAVVKPIEESVEADSGDSRLELQTAEVSDLLSQLQGLLDQLANRAAGTAQHESVGEAALDGEVLADGEGLSPLSGADHAEPDPLLAELEDVLAQLDALAMQKDLSPALTHLVAQVQQVLGVALETATTGAAEQEGGLDLSSSGLELSVAVAEGAADAGDGSGPSDNRQPALVSLRALAGLVGSGEEGAAAAGRGRFEAAIDTAASRIGQLSTALAATGSSGPSSSVTGLPPVQAFQTLPGSPGQSSAWAALQSQLGSPAFTEEMSQKLAMMVSSRIHTAQLVLNPAELGPLEIRMQLQKDQAQVQVAAAIPMVREMVEATQQRLRDLLAEQGLDLTRFDVGGQESFTGQQRGRERTAEENASLQTGAAGGELAAGGMPSTESIGLRSLVDFYA